VDQRGVSRPQEPTGCDIGAVETVATTTTVAGPSTLTPGDKATLQITVHAKSDIAGVPDGTVTVYDGTSALGSAIVTSHSTSPASVTFRFTTGALDAGSHALRAVYAATPLFRGSAGTKVVAVSATSTEGDRPPSTPGTGSGSAPASLPVTGLNPVLPLTGGALVLLGALLLGWGRTPQQARY
jgi:hypothetical protein